MYRRPRFYLLGCDTYERINIMKKKIGIFGFTGCAGDQLTIIHSEDKLIHFFSKAEIISFRMAKSDNVESELDIAFIEGSITTEEQMVRLKKIRKQTKIIVAIGTCACFGGIQSMLIGDKKYQERFKRVYGRKDITLTKAFESKPLKSFIKVDYFLPGCPINANQFFAVFVKLINDYKPNIYNFSVCTECKWHENQCLLTSKNLPCLGPVTRAGCGAVCPEYGIPCVGCWGPVEEANIAYEFELLKKQGFSIKQIKEKLRIFGGITVKELIKQIKNKE